MFNFTESFLLFLFQVASGGLFALAATPFNELDRAFYKSTAGVLYVIGLFALWGKTQLYLSGPSTGVLLPTAELLVHALFVVAFSCYVLSLWGERQVFRARSFALALICGLVGLILSSQRFHHAPLFSFETLLLPLSLFLSALLLGSVTVGMLLGHWYLIDTGQTLEPFVRIYRFFVFALVAQCLLVALSPPILYFLGAPGTQESLETAWDKHSVLVMMRLLIGQVGPLILSYMIWRTLQIPHTMAATGLFYIALLGVFVGEILSRQILTLTALPF
ncbi:MAG TPA: hypothetical protein VNO43_17235 [Candidatus Eisenbacteria bacterium]|nr:hypothetical protein [Candidatus Eisenbacteria bacterium]